MDGTAQNENEFQEPELDLDAMLADLQAGFPAPPGEETQEPSVHQEQEVANEEGNFSTDSGATTSVDTTKPSGAPIIPNEEIVPPGYAKFGDEIITTTERDALLELRRTLATDEEKARLVRDAVLGTTSPTQQQAPELPDWLDPDDAQAMYLYEQNRRMEQKLAEFEQAEKQRQAAFQQQQAEQHQQNVVTAFRSAVAQFQNDHPEFDAAHIKGITDSAYSMHLLDDPAKLDPEGSLSGGFLRALDTAVWATPQYRTLALAGDTVKTKAEKSAERKAKSSALSSSSGSTPRNNQEPKTTTRGEIMRNMLDDLRSGLTD